MHDNHIVLIVVWLMIVISVWSLGMYVVFNSAHPKHAQVKDQGIIDLMGVAVPDTVAYALEGVELTSYRLNKGLCQVTDNPDVLIERRARNLAVLKSGKALIAQCRASKVWS